MNIKISFCKFHVKLTKGNYGTLQINDKKQNLNMSSKHQYKHA